MAKQTAIFLLALLACSACSKKGKDMDLSALIPAPPAPSAPPAPEEKKPEPPAYVYPFAQKRDPFVPLIGGAQSTLAESGSGMRSGGEGSDFATLELRGIIRDKKGKLALIASSDGESYMLRSGRIYDKKNRIVGGVTGIIKENSVVLISQNKTVRELPLLKKELGVGSMRR